MRYTQITPAERYTLATLRKQQPALSNVKIARLMDRHPSTISRELRRNATPYDGAYRPSRAQEQANGRRSRTRRWSKLTSKDWMHVERLLSEQHSPDQISGRLRREGILKVSYQTIYNHILADKRAGGLLYLDLRQPARYRKRYRSKERRGRLIGKRHISERPAAVETRTEPGHWEIDTVHGTGSQHAVVTLVERAAGITLIGKLVDLTADNLTRRVIRLMRRFEQQHPGSFKTLTADNGTEFHSYEKIEKATGAIVYFATPYRSWERGTNENTNGLIRQYIPKGLLLDDLSQRRCDAIASILNNRPRQRYEYQTPLEKLAELTRPRR